MPGEVRDNTHLRRYEMVLDGAVAFVAYERDGDRIVFTHTEVPPTLSGRGVGSALVRAALDAARRERLEVVPRCEFVASFVASRRRTSLNAVCRPLRGTRAALPRPSQSDARRGRR